MSPEAIDLIVKGYISGLLDVDLSDQLDNCGYWKEDAGETIKEALMDFIEVDKFWEGWG
jgi:hypothetical protein